MQVLVFSSQGQDFLAKVDAGSRKTEPKPNRNRFATRVSKGLEGKLSAA